MPSFSHALNICGLALALLIAPIAQRGADASDKKPQVAFPEYDTCAGSSSECLTRQAYYSNQARWWWASSPAAKAVSCKKSTRSYPDLLQCLVSGTPNFDIPIYKVDATCAEHLAAQSARSQCVAVEQQNYENTKLVWDTSSVEAKTRCAKKADNQPMWNYSSLWTCLAQDIDMTQAGSVQKFKY